MTHSLHRHGSRESLRNDFVFLATPAAGINHEGSKEKLIRILDLIYQLGPANIGSYETGTILAGATIEEIKARLAEVPRVRTAFSSREKVKELIRQVKEEDLGLSITVSGLIEEVLAMAQELSIQPHSVNLSLGVHGRTADLPSEEILEFVTMCGHGMISARLVQDTIDRVKKGNLTPEQAARRIASPCVCGIFNPDRARELFQKYVPLHRHVPALAPEGPAARDLGSGALS